ncbi:hypothetical protein [Flavobacterium sp.]|uniref:hypothetical protein n=2 Tax=Flavobacterium sp. TaxID=239 RepID=UPI004047C228
MKKQIYFFCVFFVSTLFFVNCSNDNEHIKNESSNKMSRLEVEKYLSKSLFDNLKKSNLEIFEKLKSSEFSITTVDGKKTIYTTFEDYYFSDNSEIMLLSRVKKEDNQITVFDFKNQIKTSVNYTNENGKISIDEKSLTFAEFTNLPLTNKAPCKDYVGFSLCYTAVLAGTIVSGPTVVGAAGVWLTGTAYCYYAECVK